MTLKTGAGMAVAAALFATAAMAQTSAQKPPAAPAPKAPVAGQLTTQPQDTVLARDIIGQTVVSPDNAKIGSISDLLLSKDARTVEGFVIGVGGFLGIGERSVALKMDQLKIMPEANGRPKLVMDIKKEELANAPPFKSRKDMEAEKRAAERPTQPSRPQR
jgi:hypothetical protein